MNVQERGNYRLRGNLFMFTLYYQYYYHTPINGVLFSQKFCKKDRIAMLSSDYMNPWSSEKLLVCHFSSK